MTRIHKGFMCTDLDDKSDWPKYSKYARSVVEEKLESRKMYLGFSSFKKLNLVPDKKTRQWWGKYSKDKTYRSFHYYAHHLARQVLNHLHHNPGDKLLLSESNLSVLTIIYINSKECQWKQDEKKT